MHVPKQASQDAKLLTREQMIEEIKPRVTWLGDELWDEVPDETLRWLDGTLVFTMFRDGPGVRIETRFPGNTERNSSCRYVDREPDGLCELYSGPAERAYSRALVRAGIQLWSDRPRAGNNEPWLRPNTPQPRSEAWPPIA